MRLARLSLQTMILLEMLRCLLSEDGADEGGATAHGESMSIMRVSNAFLLQRLRK